MPHYVLSFKELGDPALAEIKALRKIAQLRVIEHFRGIVRIEAKEGDLPAIRKATSKWILSPMGTMKPLSGKSDTP